MIAPPASSSMAAAYYSQHQPIGPPFSSATPSHPSAFAPSFESDAPNPIGTRQQTLLDHAVIVQRLPPETTEENLRVMCIFSDELLDVSMLAVSVESDGNYRSAVLRFKSLEGAQEAQTILNGKKGMRVEHLGYRPRGPAAADRNKSGPSSGSSSTTSPATAATQPRGFDGTFSPLDKTSPSSNGNYVTSDFPAPKTGYNYKTFFSPQSPIGNPFSEQPRNTGKTLINDATDDDDTGDILSLPRAFGENGPVTAQRRSTAPQIHITERMASMSLSNGLPNGAPASQRGSGGQPGAYQPHPAHPNTMSPTAMNGVNGHYPPGPSQWGVRAHVPPPANPADMNPPCNTLYVGNLPMGSSEDELKNIFSRQRGYKRLCFRAKANGPMCFVEFDDISCATRALNELYGAPLTNSVKGGIRLSFSKNPLGVRTPQPPGQGPPGPLVGHMNHSTNGFAPAGPPPGLAAPPGLNNNGQATRPYPAAAVQNSANPNSSYPPSAMPNGSNASGNGGGALNYGGNPWGPGNYFASGPFSATNGYTSPPPMAGAQNGSGNYNAYRRGQF